jgi:putative transposase
MPTNRNLAFVNTYYYHIFNRGIDRRITFSNKREYVRAKELLSFYQYSQIPVRFSQFYRMPQSKQEEYWEAMTHSGKIVEIVAYCFMPNHFHLLLRQKSDKGIQTFSSNFSNAYTRYFNTKYKRTGLLFQGNFKAVFVESDEQLVHLIRYIHLNPVISSIIESKRLKDYPWSSYPTFINQSTDILVEKGVIETLPLPKDLQTFTIDQIDYAKQLNIIKHLLLE